MNISSTIDSQFMDFVLGSLSYRSPHNLLPVGSLRSKQNGDAFLGVADGGLLTIAQSHRAMAEMHWGDRLESLSAFSDLYARNVGVGLVKLS